MPTLTDNKITQLQSALGDTRTNLQDLEWSFYSSNSGLTPVNKYSVMDHKLAYYKLQGATGKTIQELEQAFFKLQGAQGNSQDDVAYDFYKNYGFNLGPASITNLAAWYEASDFNGTTDSDPLTGSGQLLAGTKTVGGHTWGSTCQSSRTATGAVLPAIAYPIEVTDLLTSDGNVSVNVKWNTTAGSSGYRLYGRVNSSPPTMIYAVIKNSSFEIHYYNAGTSQDLILVSNTFTSLVNNTVYTINLAVTGNFYSLTISGISTITYTDTTGNRGIEFNGTSWGWGADGGASNNLFLTTNFSFAGTFVDGAAVSAWRDKSGNNRHLTQLTAGKQPLLRLANPNILDYNTATFEDNLGVWVAGGASSVIARDISQKVSGSASMKISNSAGSAQQIGANTPISLIYPVAFAFQQWAAVCKLRAISTSPSTWQIQLIWFNSSNTEISRNSSGASTPSNSAFSTYSISATAPAGSSYVVVNIQNPPGQFAAPNDGVFVDEVELIQDVVPAAWLPPVALPNSGKAVQFDGFDDFLAFLNNVAMFSGSGATVFAVYSFHGKGSAGFPRVVSTAPTNVSLPGIGSGTQDFDNVSGFSLFWSQTTDPTTPAPTVYRNNEATGIKSSISHSQNTWHIASATLNNGSGESVWLDGAFNGSNSTSGNPAPWSIKLGENLEGNPSRSAITLAAIIIYGKVVSTIERQRIEKYLAQKNFKVLDNFQRSDGKLGNAITKQPWIDAPSPNGKLVISGNKLVTESYVPQNMYYNVIDSGLVGKTVSSIFTTSAAPNRVNYSIADLWVDDNNQILGGVDKASGNPEATIWVKIAGVWTQRAVTTAGVPSFATSTSYTLTTRYDAASGTFFVLVDNVIYAAYQLTSSEKAVLGAATKCGPRIYTDVNHDDGTTAVREFIIRPF